MTPYVAFTGFATESQGYGLSNGMRAEVDTTRLLRGEAGVKGVWRLTVKGAEPELWVKAALREEYADANRVKVNADGDFVNEISGKSGGIRRGSAGVSEGVDVINSHNSHENREGLRRQPFLLTNVRNEHFLQAGRAKKHKYILPRDS